MGRIKREKRNLKGKQKCKKVTCVPVENHAGKKK
jgi:hypothetical protein